MLWLALLGLFWKDVGLHLIRKRDMLVSAKIQWVHGGLFLAEWLITCLNHASACVGQLTGTWL